MKNVDSLQAVVKTRLFIVRLILTVLGFAILGRVFWIQIVRGDDLKEQALNQWTNDMLIEPARGNIYDRNNNPLAISAKSDTVVASIPDIKDEDIEKTAASLSAVLHIKEEDLEKSLRDAKKAKKGAIYIKRKISDEESEALKKLNLKGIYFIKETKRFYPEKNLCSQVLGFTGIDGEGLNGVELSYENYLKGTPGRTVFEKDVWSRKLPFGQDQYTPPKDGLNLVLTIDKVIQNTAESELEKALVEHNAKRGTIIVMDPKTGEILAMASKPDYDPNSYSEFDEQLWKNPAISDTYEPGSTFKIMTALASLEEGVVRPEDKFFDPGYIMVSGVKIKCWYHSGHGSQTFVQAVENSCNPVFVEVATKLGKDRFMEYINKFGFGKATGIDLPGEAKGLLLDSSKIGPIELATISFGQGISVTPIQMISALTCVANDGKMVKPHIAKALTDKNGNVVKEVLPEFSDQLVSPKTAQEMKGILESVVSNGTGGKGKIEGYSVAGKTGTAEKYSPGKYIVSYMGFAPCEDPKLAALVIIDEPKEDLIYGGTIAGPVFQKVMADSLSYLGIKPETAAVVNSGTIKLPDLRNLFIEDAKKILTQNDLVPQIEGSGYVVEEQTPAPGAKVQRDSKVILKVSSSSTNREPVIIPDLEGRTVKEATDILNAIGLNIEIIGSGYAIKQNPAPNSEVNLGTTVKVEFSQTPIED